MTTTKERPILFSGPMVSVLLAGRKTVTRRLVDPLMFIETTNPDRIVEQSSPDFGAAATEWARCPYGAPGARLWVKEAWHTSIGADDRTPGSMRHQGWPVWYAADGVVRFTGAKDGGQSFMTKGKKRNPLFMPRWASRLTLEVVSVRVERLHAITEEDAVREGVERVPDPFQEDTEYWECHDPPCVREGGCAGVLSARESFHTLWTAINGAGSWDANPWVWRVEFRKAVTP